MTDPHDNIIPPSDDTVRKLLADLREAFQLRETNEQLRMENIQLKTQLEKLKQKPYFGIHVGTYFLGLGRLTRWFSDHGAFELAYGPIGNYQEKIEFRPDDSFEHETSADYLVVLREEDGSYYELFSIRDK